MKKNKGKKKPIIIGISVLCIILFIGVFAVYGYINKKLNLLNYTTDSMVPSQVEEMDALDETEEEESTQENEEENPEDIAALEESIRQNMIANATELVFDRNVYNVLLIGSDRRDTTSNGRSDSMIIVSINKETKQVISTSLLRDIYLSIPGREQGNRINAAYSFGGADLLLSTIEQNFGMKIDNYVIVDFGSFTEIIDEIGGIELTLEERELELASTYIESTGSSLEGRVTDNKILMTGAAALGYARNRYVGKNDFARTDRQRTVLLTLFDKAKTLSLVEIDRLIEILLPKITTNITKGNIFSLILAIPEYLGYEMDSWRIPMEGTYKNMTVRKMAVLSIDFNENRTEMIRRIYGN